MGRHVLQREHNIQSTDTWISDSLKHDGLQTATKGKEKGELLFCFSVTHHLPSRRTRVSLKNYWLPSSSSTCPSETLMLRLHSSPLEEKLHLCVEHPPRTTVQNKHLAQNSAFPLFRFISPLFILPAVHAAGLKVFQKQEEGCRTNVAGTHGV